MHANVLSDTVDVDEDTTPVYLTNNSGLIFLATHQRLNTALAVSYCWPALLLLFFSIIGVVGNLLVCIAIATERRLQSRTNWCLFSLALADMLISGLVIPLAVVKEFTGFWILGPALCDLWIFFDVCSSTSSIMHIVVISIDRYVAINDPLNSRRRQQKYNILLLIILVWLIAILLSSPMIVLGAINPHNIFIDRQCTINNKFFVIYGSVVSFVIPLIIVIIMYALTVRRLKEQIRQCQKQLAQEQLTRAVSLAAKPFLRRPIPEQDDSITTNNDAMPSHWTKVSSKALRRMRLRRQEVSLELSEESADNTSLQQQKEPQQQVPQEESDQGPQMENKSIAPQELISPTSVKSLPHFDYDCPKNPFCQLKCTCNHQQQQQQPLETVFEPETNIGCFKCIRCCKITISSPALRQRFSPKSSSIRKTINQSFMSSNVSTSRRITTHWSRLTISPKTGVTRTKSSSIRNEQKALKVLGFVFVIFVVAWFPFCITNMLQGVCERCYINQNMLNGFVWLGYVSSTINPLVYTVFNRNFRLKFIDLLKCHCAHSRPRHRFISYYKNQSSLQKTRRQGKSGENNNDHHPPHTYYEQRELKVMPTASQNSEIS